MDVSKVRAEVTVLLPHALRKRTGNRGAVAVAGDSVAEVVTALDDAYPGMRFHLCYETGELRPYVNIFVDGENVRYLQGLQTPVAQGARLHVIESVAGG
jgi:molybdopterin synthase sulfur carrier subunit